MRRRIPTTKRHQAGYSIESIVLGLIVVAVLFGALYNVYAKTDIKTSAKQLTEDLASMSKCIRQSYRSTRYIYTGLAVTNLSDSCVSGSLMRTPTNTIDTPFQTALTLAAGPAPATTFLITVPTTVNGQCSELASQLLPHVTSGLFRQLTIDGTAITTPGQIEALCSDAAADTLVVTAG